MDTHLNCEIGPDWMLRGKQQEVLTPGQNQGTRLPRVMSQTFSGGQEKVGDPTESRRCTDEKARRKAIS